MFSPIILNLGDMVEGWRITRTLVDRVEIAVISLHIVLIAMLPRLGGVIRSGGGAGGMPSPAVRL
jgi:hypothetical protein